MNNAKPQVSTQGTQKVGTQKVGTEKDDNYYMKKYAPVINEWKQVISSGSLLDNPKYTEDLDSTPGSSAKYIFVDLNNNGSKEMVVSDVDNIYAIYTLKNEIPITCAVSLRRYYTYILDNGDIYCTGNEMGVHIRTVKRLDKDDNLVNKLEVSATEDSGKIIYRLSDKEISEKEYDEICKKNKIGDYYSEHIDAKYTGVRSF